MRTNRGIGAAAILGIFGLATLGGCDIVVGIGTYCTEGVDPGCGTTATGGTGGVTATGGTTTGGVGGVGGGGGTTITTGGTGGTPCETGQTEACYSGPKETDGVGPCRPGMHTCQDGSWGKCVGEVTPQPEDCSAAGDEDCNFGVGCSETVWSGIWGDMSSQRVDGIAFDKDGNLYVAGHFDGTLNIGGDALISSGGDVFVAKFDSAGNPKWGRRYGDAASQDPRALAVDTDGSVVVVGNFAGNMQIDQTTLTSMGGTDVFAFKLDANGNKVWARRFGDAGSQQSANDVTVNAAHEVILVGNFDGKLDFDGHTVSTAGLVDAFVAKLSQAGDGVWAKQYGDAQAQYGNAVTVDSNGNVLFAGQFAGVIDFGGGDMITASSSDVYLARLDSFGNYSWSRKISTTGSGQVGGLYSDQDGSALLVLETNQDLDVGDGNIAVSSYDVIAAKYSAGNTFQWKKHLGGTGDEYGPCVTTDKDNRVIVALYSSDTFNLGSGDLVSGGGLDLVVSTFEPNGDLLWAKRYGKAGDQLAPSLAVGPEGQIAVGCTASGTINFGSGDLMSMGNDIVLAEIGPN